MSEKVETIEINGIPARCYDRVVRGIETYLNKTVRYCDGEIIEWYLQNDEEDEQ